MVVLQFTLLPLWTVLVSGGEWVDSALRVFVCSFFKAILIWRERARLGVSFVGIQLILLRVTWQAFVVILVHGIFVLERPLATFPLLLLPFALMLV